MPTKSRFMLCGSQMAVNAGTKFSYFLAVS